MQTPGPTHFSSTAASLLNDCLHLMDSDSRPHACIPHYNCISSIAVIPGGFRNYI